MKNFINNKKIMVGLLIFGIVMIVIGSSLAFFNYTRTGESNRLITGNIYLTLNEGLDQINLENVFPMTKEEARSKTNNFITFTLSGVNTSDKDIYYEIKLKYGDDKDGYTRFNDKDLVFDLVEVGDNNEETYIVDAKSFDSYNDRKVWVDTVDHNTTTEIVKTYKLRVWLSEDVIISDSDSNRSYCATDNCVTGEVAFKKHYASVKISVFGDFTEKEPPLTGTDKVLKAITSNATGTCQDIIYEEDDIKYFSGTNDCINFNYVWYSGKLWRITAIYPDGSMKMITEDALTAINWGSTVEYDGSWVYQWLNEDFYDTLVNPSDIIIANSIWNYSTDGNSTPVKPETIATQKTKEALIGLLNAYEYYNSYRKVSYSTGYLNIGYYWWLLTPYSTSRVRNVNYDGNLYNGSTSGSTYGVRPSVNLKSGLEFAGSGTKTNPYKIVGDKEDPTNGTLISSRSVGEYVKFDGDNYRIVSIDETNGTTKLTRVDYLRDNGTVVTKNFASSAYFGNSTNTQTDTYWDYYLNNTWYNNINTTYKSMLVDGTYYLGLYPDNTNYKATLCKDTASTLDSITTKNCTKYTSSDVDKTFTGKVGLPRVGEMFSDQLGSGYSSSSNIWTITPYSSSYVRLVNLYGNQNGHSPSSNANGVRPSIVIKSGIKITGGTGYFGGDTNSPFEISE